MTSTRLARPAADAPPPPYPAPPGRTVRRVEWSFLPPVVRRWVEHRLGSPVVDAVSRGGGFTPAMASVLTCADGTRHFVKAASARAQRAYADSYREEARRLAALPAALAAPHLRWTHEADGWVVLETAHVAGRAPARPWEAAELDRCLDLLATTADLLTPAPPDLVTGTLAEETAGWAGRWADLEPRWRHPQLAEATDLAHRATQALAGDTAVHLDVRADNLLLTEHDDGDDGEARALLCDWTWPARGAAWVDSLALLVEAHGDGVDAETVLRRHPTFSGVEDDRVDAALALHAGQLLHAGTLPVPRTSPWVRAHQAWQGAAAWRWLAARRGWSPDLGGLVARC